MYFLGVAIGLVLVGFLISTRQAMLGNQQPGGSQSDPTNGGP